MKKILYFSASWCSPCRTLSPIMESLANQINYQKIDIDHNPYLVSKYDVKSIPTVILLENEKEISRFTGVKDRQQIISFYNQ